MLAVLHDFHDHWKETRRALVKNPEDANQLLLLSEGPGSSGYGRLLTHGSQRRWLQFQNDLAAGRLIDRISAAKDAAVKLEDVQSVLSHYDMSFRSGVQQLYKFEYIEDVWVIKNLMIAKSFPQGKDAVVKLLEDGSVIILTLMLFAGWTRL